MSDYHLTAYANFTDTSIGLICNRCPTHAAQVQEWDDDMPSPEDVQATAVRHTAVHTEMDTHGTRHEATIVIHDDKPFLIVSRRSGGRLLDPADWTLTPVTGELPLTDDDGDGTGRAVLADAETRLAELGWVTVTSWYTDSVYAVSALLGRPACIHGRTIGHDWCPGCDGADDPHPADSTIVVPAWSERPRPMCRMCGRNSDTPVHQGAAS